MHQSPLLLGAQVLHTPHTIVAKAPVTRQITSIVDIFVDMQAGSIGAASVGWA